MIILALNGHRCPDPRVYSDYHLQQYDARNFAGVLLRCKPMKYSVSMDRYQMKIEAPKYGLHSI